LTSQSWLPSPVARAVAPLWPLRHFVAVNPFLGLADRSFADAACELARVAGARLTMPRSFYAGEIAAGRLARQHVEEALSRARAAGRALPEGIDAAAVLALAAAGDRPAGDPTVPTVAGVAGAATGLDLERFVVDRLSAWAASYFDEGQATWASPWRRLSPFAAWHAEASRDRTPDVMGLAGWRSAVEGYPSVASEAATRALAGLALPAALLPLYLHRLLRSVGGWAAYARYRGWDLELAGDTDGRVEEVLAARVVYDAALLESMPGLAPKWRAAIERAAAGEESAGVDLEVDLVLQDAYEAAWRDGFGETLALSPRPSRERPARPAAQAAFCIDVRSEVLRRALEAADPAIETIGFAGFFGFPIEYVPVGLDRGGAQCPVLLKLTVVVRETIRGAADAQVASAGARRVERRRAANAWKAFKHGAIACFSFVGPVGLLYARKLATDALGLTRTVEHPSVDGVDGSAHRDLGPSLEPSDLGGRRTGLPVPERVAMAEAALRAMSLTGGLARLVLLAGHGSTTVNNPHATALDCGACGGHTGEANARVAAAVLNDPAVRAGLRGTGLELPDDTVFVAGLHDTTTDEVRLFDEDQVPASHRADLRRLAAALAAAGRRARAERAPALDVAPGEPVDDAIRRRARDWSQVRPEWGLAGCAAFVAAPRDRTAGLDLRGRVFLHSYDWRADRDFRVLELILTAPVVVASWISLQYYGSTVDNERFGSGNKALHNVVGALGVLEGSGGDLRTGLPWQSVHDGRRFVHEPLRLTVAVEAPADAIGEVLARHSEVRALADNGWLHLWALDRRGVSHVYSGGLRWTAARGATRTGDGAALAGEDAA